MAEDIEKGRDSTVAAEEGSVGTLASSTDIQHDYVEYVRPKENIVLPPAKYKLFLIVFTQVWFAGKGGKWNLLCVVGTLLVSLITTPCFLPSYPLEWVSSLTGFYSAVQTSFNFSRYGTLFVVLGTIVATLVYGSLDLAILYLKVKVGDTVYGVGPWLKQPRIKFFQEYTNVFSQFCARIIHILENGFELFSVAPPPAAATKKKEEYISEKQQDHVSKDVVLRIVSHIREDKRDDYKKWVEQLKGMGCLTRPGIKQVISNFTKDPEDGVYVWFITFNNIDSLNDFMTSPVHDRMVRNLQPLLVNKSVYQLTQERDLPDAFTDIVTPQSQGVPKLLPKKWKVLTITFFGLWFTFMIGDSTLEAHYYEVWGLNDAHPRAAATLRVLFNVFFNTYVMVPFLTMLFGHWMKRKEYEQEKLEPWRTLNDGFPSVWGKLIVTIAYFGGCLIGYLVKR